jgi:hypothetical protein
MLPGHKAQPGQKVPMENLAHQGHKDRLAQLLLLKFGQER